MSKSKKAEGSEVLVEVISNAILEKKGEDVLVMNLKSIPTAVCDYFVICSGNSDTHVKSISEEIEKEVKHILGENVYHKEGHQNAKWILLDYADVVTHVFQKESRSFYNLEGLWADATIQKVDEEIKLKASNG